MDTRHSALFGRAGAIFTAVAPEPLSFKPLQQSLLETFGFTLLIASQTG